MLRNFLFKLPSSLIKGLLIFSAIIVSFLFLFLISGVVLKETNVLPHRAEASLPPQSGFIRYELAGHNFKIPVGYHFSVYESRGNRWPEVDTPIQKVEGGVVFDFFLPDFDAYGKKQQALYISEKYSEFYKSKIYVGLSEGDFGFSPQERIKQWESQGKKIDLNGDSVPGVVEYIVPRSNFRHFYTQEQNDHLYFRMVCDVRCTVYTKFAEYPDVKVQYSFSEDMLQRWHEFDGEVLSKIKEFEVNTF